MGLSSGGMYFEIDRDSSSTSMWGIVFHHSSCNSKCIYPIWLKNCSWDIWQGMEGFCGRRGLSYFESKMARNTDQLLMHSLMSVSGEYHPHICHFQGSFWIFSSSTMWLYNRVTNFVVVLSLEDEPLLVDCYSSVLSQIYSDMTALLIAATEVCLWNFQTSIHIFSMLNNFYLRSLYAGLGQHCITPQLCW